MEAVTEPRPLFVFGRREVFETLSREWSEADRERARWCTGVEVCGVARGSVDYVMLPGGCSHQQMEGATIAKERGFTYVDHQALSAGCIRPRLLGVTRGAGVEGLFPIKVSEEQRARLLYGDWEAELERPGPFAGVNRAPVEPHPLPLTLEQVKKDAARLTAAMREPAAVMHPRDLQKLKAWEREHGIDAITGRRLAKESRRNGARMKLKIVASEVSNTIEVSAVDEEHAALVSERCAEVPIPNAVTWVSVNALCLWLSARLDSDLECDIHYTPKAVLERITLNVTFGGSEVRANVAAERIKAQDVRLEVGGVTLEGHSAKELEWNDE